MTILALTETTIAAVKSGHWTRREKFGIPLPKSAAEALHFDEEFAKKGLPRLWKPAIDKEMNAVMIAFEFVGHKKPDGYKVIRCHLVYDVKMNLTRKARMVAEGNLAKPDSDIPVLCCSSISVPVYLGGFNAKESALVLQSVRPHL